ncbi:hypothetical protein HYN48_02020 [Flavobacterium magnum]|uniref:Uncharacterized protein n=1 Tax=Flavobacterium magnum TaxID=2162713 RepID=A0A2S0RCH2_9FLAO|nr:hypothetical protein HYN48_02020 [Flavobacterium magnum]
MPPAGLSVAIFLHSAALHEDFLRFATDNPKRISTAIPNAAARTGHQSGKSNLQYPGPRLPGTHTPSYSK